jgi:Tyrosine phosphatase family
MAVGISTTCTSIPKGKKKEESNLGSSTRTTEHTTATIGISLIFVVVVVVVAAVIALVSPTSTSSCGWKTQPVTAFQVDSSYQYCCNRHHHRSDYQLSLQQKEQDFTQDFTTTGHRFLSSLSDWPIKTRIRNRNLLSTQMSATADTINSTDGDGSTTDATAATTNTSNNTTASTIKNNKDDGIQNFRPVAGIPHGTIYRCASTDVLGKRLLQMDNEHNNKNNNIKDDNKSSPTTPEWTDADRIVLEKAGLILDLRSDVERNDSEANAWVDYVNNNNYERRITNTTMATTTTTTPIIVRTVSSDDIDNDNDDGPVITLIGTDLSSPSSMDPNTSRNSTSSSSGGGGGGADELLNRRHIVRVDVLNPQRFMRHVDAAWLSSSSSVQLAWYKLVSGTKLHNMRMKELNERGLAGLNEAILESGQQCLCWSLKTITLYREKVTMKRIREDHLNYDDDSTPNKIVIHCVQGKDRTGMLAMLIQIILGVPDDVIISDYFQSNKELLGTTETGQSNGAGSSAATTLEGKLDRRIFSGTSREAMIATLHYTRSTYGSFDNYLDAIGFDKTWRRRLRSTFDICEGSPGPTRPTMLETNIRSKL